MRIDLVEAVVRGDRFVWSVAFALWLGSAAAVFLLRRPPAGRASSLVALFALSALLGALGLGFTSAVSLPRLRWRTVPSSAVIADSGDTWHALRGPATYVADEGLPDLALPGLDKTGQWRLFGLLSGEPIVGLPAAPAVAPAPGAARLCDARTCRAWPSSWPDPSKPTPFADLTWSASSAPDALAYDGESRLYLRGASGLDPEGRGLELTGRLSSDAPHEGYAALFVVRRIAAGRLDSLRVVASATSHGPTYRVDRASAALDVAPGIVRAVARPALVAALLGPVLAVLALLLAPAVLAMRLRGRATRHTLPKPLTLWPLPAQPSGSKLLATVVGDVELGDVRLADGTVVAALLAPQDGQPVASTAWFELPAPRAVDASATDAAHRDAPEAMPAAPSTARKLGLFVPADPIPFARVARLTTLPLLHAVGVLLVGLGIAAPAIAAIAGLAAAR